MLRQQHKKKSATGPNQPQRSNKSPISHKGSRYVRSILSTHIKSHRNASSLGLKRPKVDKSAVLYSTRNSIPSHIATDPFLGPAQRVMSNQAPAFPLNSDQITIIEHPMDFYEEIITGIENAKHRICISSLYLGTDTHEQKIISTIESSLNKQPDLSVHFLFDMNRGLRQENPDKPEHLHSSYAIVANLASLYPNRVSLSLYTPALGPDMLDGPLKEAAAGAVLSEIRQHLPGKASELFSVHHMKAYIFDNNTIMSGANLSKIYFENRQDRYMKICDDDLSDYLTAVIRTMSYGDRETHRMLYYTNKEECWTEAQVGSGLLQDDEPTPTTLDHRGPVFMDDSDNPWWNYGPVKTVHVNHPEGQKQALNELLDPNIREKHGQYRRSKKIINIDNCDTIIYPTIQLRSHGIRQEEAASTELMGSLIDASLPEYDEKSGELVSRAEHADINQSSSSEKQASLPLPYPRAFSGVTMYMATGYFNLALPYLNVLSYGAEKYQKYHQKTFDLKKLINKQTKKVEDDADDIINTDGANTITSDATDPKIREIEDKVAQLVNQLRELEATPGKDDATRKDIDQQKKKIEHELKVLWDSVPAPFINVMKKRNLSETDEFKQQRELVRNTLNIKDLLSPIFGVKIIAASEEANGWHGHGHITGAYKLLIDNFNTYCKNIFNKTLSDVVPSAKVGDLRIINTGAIEYIRPDWTFHAKGLFIQPRVYDGTTINPNYVPNEPWSNGVRYIDPSKPVITTIGSSNYGYRSVNWDSELQLTILSKPTKVDKTNIHTTLASRLNDDITNSLFYTSMRPKKTPTPASTFLARLGKQWM